MGRPRAKSSGSPPRAESAKPVGGGGEGDRFELTDDLLLSRFQEKPLARFLEATIPKKELIGIAPKVGLSPLPGKRLKTMTPQDHARLLARAALAEDRPRKALLEALGGKLPTPLLGDETEVGEDEADRWFALANELDFEVRLRLSLSVLKSEERAKQLMTALEEGFLDQTETAEPEPDQAGEIDRLKAQAARAEQRAQRAERALKEHDDTVEQRENGLRQRIEELQQQLTELQERLGKKNRECDEIRGEWERLKGDLQVAFRRAARFKHQLDEIKDSSERERELKEALVRERQRAEIEGSKVEILEYQLDLLEQDEESDAESASKKPAHDPTPDRVVQYVEKFGSPPKILIVGGAGKQRTHREKDFEALKARLGVEGEWRFADYTSWHRELPRLRNDIRDRFDLVLVLHWNRTTFVQKMHDEARSQHGRVRTVPYRGFLSLERAVTEEVDRFVQEKLQP